MLAPTSSSRCVSARLVNYLRQYSNPYIIITFSISLIRAAFQTSKPKVIFKLCYTLLESLILTMMHFRFHLTTRTVSLHFYDCAALSPSHARLGLRSGEQMHDMFWLQHYTSLVTIKVSFQVCSDYIYCSTSTFSSSTYTVSGGSV